MVRNITKLRIDCNPQWETRYEVSLRLFHRVISLNRIKAVDEECLYPLRRPIQTLFVFGAYLYYVFNYNIVYINIWSLFPFSSACAVCARNREDGESGDNPIARRVFPLIFIKSETIRAKTFLNLLSFGINCVKIYVL